jgi:hypothetical protein
MPTAIVLVMAEYAVDLPLWYRGSRERVGTADADELGLSASLRDDLRGWNDVFERASSSVFDDRRELDPVRSSRSVSAGAWDAHRVDAFTLASRVQLELGDDAHVWCGGGGGIDMVSQAGTAVVLASGRSGSEVEFLLDGKRDVRSARAAGSREGTSGAIARWRARTDLAGTPFGDAETRALGLRAAGRLQGDIGTDAQVVFCAGASAPYSHDEFD